MTTLYNYTRNKKNIGFSWTETKLMCELPAFPIIIWVSHQNGLKLQTLPINYRGNSFI